MEPTLLKALILLVPLSLLSGWSSVAFFQQQTRWSFLQLVGAGALVVVALTHVAEAVGLFPLMRWGAPDSPGHYLDLGSAVLGFVLLPIGYLGAKRGW
jgi:hypothetical protein